MKLVATLRESLSPAVDLVYPPRCPLCGDGIEAQSGLCASCWATLRIPGEPCCAACQRPLPATLEHAAVCAPCMADPPRHDGIAAATLYNDPARALVLAFKHGRRIALAKMLARLMVARMPGVDGDWLIVPVPLHRWRLWRRGYNQAALLAGEIGKAKGASVRMDALVRHRATPALGGLGRTARRKALVGAIAVNRRHAGELRGRNVLLVDDVLTSGATSSACVTQLKRAGANKVMISCFARVIDDSETGVHAWPPNETPGI